MNLKKKSKSVANNEILENKKKSSKENQSLNISEKNVGQKHMLDIPVSKEVNDEITKKKAERKKR